jgi:toxin FitB
LLVPTVTIHEVFKVILRQRGEDDALLALSVMQKGIVVDLTKDLAISAAVFGIKHHLPLADSIVYATAMAYNATIWTQDVDFRDLPGVKHFSSTPQQ